MELPSLSGIYKITCTTNEEFYIGSAVNMRRRQQIHLWYLMKNKHANIHLQRLYNKYGINSLIFEVLEYCETDKLIECEQYCIDTFNPTINVCRVANSSKGKVLSEETKRKIRNTQLKIPMTEILQHIKNWQISELSRLEYCRQNELNYGTFYCWLNKYRHLL